MTDLLTVHMTCAPGTATAQRALDCQDAVIKLLTHLADDVAPGAVTFRPVSMEWVNDGKDDVVIVVKGGGE